MQTKSILASNLAPGQWLVYTNQRMNQRVVEVENSRDGDIKVMTDYGNGGEPATSFFDPNEYVTVAA